jgi:hypothetical protein
MEVPTDNVWPMFRSLSVEASIASGFDSRKVRAMDAWLRRIDEAGKPYHERGDMPNEEAAELAQRAALEQEVAWGELSWHISDYRGWIEWKLTKRPWSLHRSRRMW